MGILDAFSEIVEAVAPWSVVEAEAPAEEPKEDSATETKSKNDDDASAGEKVESEDSKDNEDEDGEEADEEDEDEEDEEEIVDPKETLEEECKKSAQCAPAKHHFDDCVERVQKQESDGEAKEDCVEEFFHLAHCATACAAPKLWSKLK